MTQLEEQIQQCQSTSIEQNKKLLELQQQAKAVPEILDRLTKLEQSVSTIQPISIIKTDVTTQTVSLENDLSSSNTTNYTLDKLLESIQSLTYNFVPLRRRYSSSVTMRRRSGSRMSRVSSGCGSMFNEYEDVQDQIHSAGMPEELEPSSISEPAAPTGPSSDQKTTISSFQQDQALGSVLLAMEDMLQNIKYYRHCHQ